MIAMIVFIKLRSALIRSVPLFILTALFAAGERLKHPIIIVLAAILLVTRQPRLHRSLKLVLFDFGLTLISLLNHQTRCLLFIVVWSGSRIAFSRAHQPLINLLVSFEDTLVIWSSIIGTQCALLGYHKVDLGNDRAVSSWVFPGRGGRLRL